MIETEILNRYHKCVKNRCYEFFWYYTDETEKNICALTNFNNIQTICDKNILTLPKLKIK